MFCFDAKKKGMTVSAIRKAIQDFQWAKMSPDEYAKQYLSEHGAPR